MKQPRINVIVWFEDYSGAYHFVRSVVPFDPHFIIVRINGEEVCYSSCGLNLADCPKGLPRDAQAISRELANSLPTFIINSKGD